MNENDMMQIRNGIAMPENMADTLSKNAGIRKKSFRYSRYSKMMTALAVALALLATGTTSHAAYNIYQEKNLAVFMEYGLTQEEIEQVGQSLRQIPGISSCRFVSGEEAWEEFQSAYLTPELSAEFTENPLKDSFNYRLGVRLNVDTQAVRDEISRIDGVRLVQNLEELAEDEKSSIR